MYDHIIVGGGLIGMLMAREMHLQGQRVLLLDQGQPGHESSWAGGGILSPLYPWRYPQAVSALARFGHDHYQQLAQAIHDESGIDPEWTRSGMLMLDCPDATEAQQWAQQQGHEMSAVEAGSIDQVQPGLAVEPQNALWMPAVAQMRNPRLVKALRASLEKLQVPVCADTEVLAIEQEQGRVKGVRTWRGVEQAGNVIVTAGAWSAKLLDPLGQAFEVQPVRGQMLVYKARPGVLERIVLHDGRYLIPRRDGHILIGSTQEFCGFDKSTTDHAGEELAQKAISMLPALAEFEIEKHWSGLRPGTPAGIPYIGAHPDIAGLYFNTGHFRNGVILALGSVRLLADIILQRTAWLDPSPYSLESPH